MTVKSDESPHSLKYSQRQWAAYVTPLLLDENEIRDLTDSSDLFRPLLVDADFKLASVYVGNIRSKNSKTGILLAAGRLKALLSASVNVGFEVSLRDHSLAAALQMVGEAKMLGLNVILLTQWGDASSLASAVSSLKACVNSDLQIYASASTLEEVFAVIELKPRGVLLEVAPTGRVIEEARKAGVRLSCLIRESESENVQRLENLDAVDELVLVLDHASSQVVNVPRRR